MNKIQIDKKLYYMLDDINCTISDNFIDLTKEVDYGKYGIEKIFMDKNPNIWRVKKREDDKPVQMKVKDIINYFFPDKFTPEAITEFLYDYFALYKKLFKLNNVQVDDKSTPLEVKDFSFKPDDVVHTFLTLVTETYPHGTEEEVVKYLPKMDKDKFGNYYKIIGNSKVMFTSHIDTASRDKSKVNLRKLIENNEEFVITDGTTILGADDKAGVAVMMYMMHHNIPGIYYIFIGEERGGIGSHAVARDFESFPFLKDVDKCISFDRRNYHSVITSQLGQTCCSESFGVALVNELNAAGLDMKLDNTGVYTDSASFIDIIPECTNISVGYFNEHTGNEKQNLTFLKRLAEASIKVNWESLPSERKVGLSEELMFQFGDLIKDYKRINFNCVTTLSEGFYKDSIQLSLEVSENYLEVLEDLYDIEKLTNKHMAPTIVAYEDYYILIDIFKN